MPRPAEAQLEKPEPELIVDARNGDLDAMTELFRRHYSHSVTVARRMLPAREEFLDAVQSAYLSAFRQFQSFRGEASFKTWITRIVLNQCLMHLRDPGQPPDSSEFGRTRARRHSAPDGGGLTHAGGRRRAGGVSEGYRKCRR